MPDHDYAYNYDEVLKKVYDPNAERIMRTGAIEDNGLLIYEVPDGHSFYLEEAALSIEVSRAVASDYCYLYWQRGADAYYVRDLCQIFWFVGKQGAIAMMKVGDHSVFPSGLLMAAGDMIWLISEEAGYAAEGKISGQLVVGDL